MLFHSKTRKIKYFLDTSPPKKRLRDMNGCDMATRKIKYFLDTSPPQKKAQGYEWV